MSLIYDHTAKLVRDVYDRRILGSAVLGLAEFFPDGRKFVRNWEAIRDEATAVAVNLNRVPRFHDIMKEQTDISANDGRDWRMFILKAYGIWMPKNRAACPVLSRLVDQSPEVLSASISFLAPGKHIPPHRGPFRGVLRFYLVLAMPIAADGRPAAVLKIAGTEYRLGEGESLLWDDTYEHEAWNASDTVRMVLLLDVWRPFMPWDMKLLSMLLIRLVRVAMKFRRIR
jgi:aspartate beta-hydroxylase